MKKKTEREGKKNVQKAECFDKYCMLVCVAVDTIRGVDCLPSRCISEIVNQCRMRLRRLEEERCAKKKKDLINSTTRQHNEENIGYGWSVIFYFLFQQPFCICNPETGS